MAADYIAYCSGCGGVVLMADASTEENKKSNQKYAKRWADEGYRVEFVAYLTDDPRPRWCEHTLTGGCS